MVFQFSSFYVQQRETSRPKASNGQQFPCPASLYWPRSSFGKQGSGPNRGQSPVEWGDFPYIHLPTRPLPPLSHPARPGAQPAWTRAQPARPRGGNVQMYVGKISPFSRTSSPIGATALLPKGRFRPIKRSRVRESVTT